MRKINKKYWLKEKEFLIDLTLSENPLGIPSIIKREINLEVSRYPKTKKLIEAVSIRFCVPKENIIVGAGVDEFIGLIPQLLLKKGDLVLMPKVTFPRFEMTTRIFSGKPVFIQMREDLKIDFAAFEKRIQRRVKLIFIANPNNPTGLVEDKKKIIKLVKKTKAILVDDEAGIDFVGEENSLVREAPKLKNLIVLRSFSKGFGMAGLRIGFCVASPGIIAGLQAIKPPFSVSSVSIEAAILALRDKEHLRKTKKFFKKEKKFLLENLKKLGFGVLPPESNFIFARMNPIFSSAKDFIEAINKKGANCVGGENFHMPRFIRISPRDREKNEKFIQTVGEVIKERSKQLHLVGRG